MLLRRSLSSSTSRRRIAVAMSGGVDSSVAAHLLQQQYTNNDKDHELLGIHMSNWDYRGDDDDVGSKCWEQDWKDAKAVAQHLDMPIVHTSFEAEYWNDVFEPYCQQLSKSVTPNPDVDCNRYIKFGVLKDYLQTRYQIDTLATGHYARVWDPTTTTTTTTTDNNHKMPEYLQEALDQDPSMADLMDPTQPTLLAARDAQKDQSYFLTGVQGGALRNVLFPLGDLLKQTPTLTTPADGTNHQNRTVRQIAVDAQLPTAHKRDSMGICFVGKRKHATFIQEYVDVDSDVDHSESTSNSTSRPKKQQEEGRCINVEDGSIVATFCPRTQPTLVYATIGQGAKIPGEAQKWFVVDKPDPWTVLICPGTHHPALYADSLVVDDIDMNWIAGHPPPEQLFPLNAQCRIRHLQPLVECEIRKRLPDGYGGSGGYEIILQQPLRGIAPGQVCGIYVNDLLCLGGGAISKRGPTYLELQKALPAHLHPAGHNDLSR
jgi:tRNA U34 2-thiouridine synthase MnmA/TrmU